MPLQRARVAESRVRNKLSNGPLRVQSNAISQSILQRVGIRQLPGICWYPAKGAGFSREYKVAPRIKCIYSSLIEFFLSRAFFIFQNSFDRNVRGVFFIRR